MVEASQADATAAATARHTRAAAGQPGHTDIIGTYAYAWVKHSSMHTYTQTGARTSNLQASVPQHAINDLRHHPGNQGVLAPLLLLLLAGLLLLLPWLEVAATLLLQDLDPGLGSLVCCVLQRLPLLTLFLAGGCVLDGGCGVLQQAVGQSVWSF